MFSGITVMLLQSGPETLEARLPWGVVVAWGATLTLGSAITLIGIARDTDNGVLAEQVGSVMVGMAAIFYSAIAVGVAGIPALQIVSIVAAWGFACLYRWAQLQALIDDALDHG